jgi:two-component system NtrC family sensor kinase
MLRKIKDVATRSLRYKLLILLLFPILLVTPAVLGVAAYWADKFTDDQLFRKVNTDLSVAHDAFNRIQHDHLDALKYLAESYEFRTNLEKHNLAQVQDQLQILQKTAGFDFLHISGPQRHWLGQVGSASSGMNDSPLVNRVLRTGTPVAGVEVLTGRELREESPVLAARASMALVDTAGATPVATKVEKRGLILRAVYPVKDRHGSVVALLDGGVMLNRNFTFVDAIRDLVYGKGSVPESGWGAVTVFLGDVRVSTNVPYSFREGERALGTRAPEQVRKQVLEGGSKWIDRTYVVNNWYISAYEPIVDTHGNWVGMLNTEYLERPFLVGYHRALMSLVLMLVLAAVFAALLAIRGATSIFKPIEAMTAVVRAEQAGQSRRIGSIQSQDEIGELARQFDRMLDLLDERTWEIRQAADQLEVKVEERTRELQEKNTRLQNMINLLRQTRQRLVLAEKLAALGELTAGVAHEINNPTAVILGNMDVIISELGDRAAPIETEVNLIVEQVYRIRAIVDKLLQYSRPREYVGIVDLVNVSDIIDDTLLLVKHELAKQDTVVEKSYGAQGEVRINRQDLQQVLVNLLLNAAHAIPRGGKIELSTVEWAERGVIVSVKDYGEGIPANRLGRVFEPFYTTRGSSGTGLGLSVSYELIRRYGGHIAVKSEEGQWTRFDIFLRREPRFVDSEELLSAHYMDAS